MKPIMIVDTQLVDDEWEMANAVLLGVAQRVPAIQSALFEGSKPENFVWVNCGGNRIIVSINGWRGQSVEETINHVVEKVNLELQS